jgi:hypothetical protein
MIAGTPAVATAFSSSTGLLSLSVSEKRTAAMPVVPSAPRSTRRPFSGTSGGAGVAGAPGGIVTEGTPGGLSVD